MILSDVLSHDDLDPAAGDHVESVSVRCWRLCVTGAAKAAAHSAPRTKKVCIVPETQRCRGMGGEGGGN